MLGSWRSSCPEVSEWKLNHKDWEFNVKPALPVRKLKNTHQVEFERLVKTGGRNEQEVTERVRYL
jgi:hypothetical protein